MGIRDRIKSRLKSGVSNIKAFAAVIHDEANHPGRPSPHMAARNPLWGGETGAGDADESASLASENTSENSAEPPIEHPVPEERRAPDGEEFWFLKDDDAEGWSETNPGLSDQPSDK